MADEPLTLEQVKEHLKLDATDTSQDAYLGTLISAARRSIEKYTSRTIFATWPTLDMQDRVMVAQAMRLMIAHWFVNREGSEGMPPGVRHLIRPLKRFTL